MLWQKKAIISFCSLALLADVIPSTEPYWEAIKSGGSTVLLGAAFYVFLQFMWKRDNLHQQTLKAISERHKENMTDMRDHYQNLLVNIHNQMIKVAESNVESSKSTALALQANTSIINSNTTAIDRLSNAIERSMK